MATLLYDSSMGETFFIKRDVNTSSVFAQTSATTENLLKIKKYGKI